jgi:hypothetical protein
MVLLDGELKLTQLKLYENVVIGNFLYGLGFAISAKSNATVFPSIVNLSQQTPMDKPLGDVLLEFTDGIVRLIEFKNKKSDHEKELEKYDNLIQDLQRMIIDEALKGMSERYQNISRSIHWFIETDPKENDFTSRVVPYLDAYPTGDPRCADNSNFTFEEFVKLTAEAAVNKQNSFSKKDLSAYLWHVARLQIGLKKDGSKKDIPESSAMLICMSSTGDIKVVGLPDMMLLKLQDREYIQEIQYRQKLDLIQDIKHELMPESETNQSLGRQIAQQPKIERNIPRDRGLSL